MPRIKLTSAVCKANAFTPALRVLVLKARKSDSSQADGVTLMITKEVDEA